MVISEFDDDSKMSRKIHYIDIVRPDFASIAQLSDGEVYQKMLVTCKLIRQRLLPKRIRWNAYRVMRTPKSVTIHLFAAKDQPGEPTEVARFGFIAGPGFRRSA
jgi:hypothetical protein